MGLTFAWVKIKISALKNCKEFILVKCALREALKVVDYIRHLRNEGLWGKENSKRISGLLNIKRRIERKLFVAQTKVHRVAKFK